MNRPDSSRPWWVLPSGRIRPAWWLLVAPVLIWVDYLAGPDSQVPVGYALPVCVAAWYSGQRSALSLAVILPLAHLIFVLTVWHSPDSLGVVALAIPRAAVVAFIALVFARQSEHERELRRDLERRHAVQLQAEQLRVVQVTMRTVHDIVNNCLNQVQLLRMDAEEGRVSAESIRLFDEAITDAAAQLKRLGDLGVYAEKQIGIGTTLDVGATDDARRPG